MSQAPYMPLFVDAYVADTGHLSTEENGAYLLLLMAMWRRGGTVPDDDRDNARIVGLSRPKWRATKERLRPFLTFEDNEISQKRLRKEWEHVALKRQKMSENGSKGGRPAASENKDLAKAEGFQNEKPTESTYPYPYKEEESGAGAPVIPIPAEAEFEAWYRAYPKHVGKGQARKAYRAARKKAPVDVLLTAATEAARRYRTSQPEFIPNPATWLNGERWLDEAPQQPSADIHQLLWARH